MDTQTIITKALNSGWTKTATRGNVQYFRTANGGKAWCNLHTDQFSMAFWFLAHG